MRLILVRHGQTSSNVIHALDTGEPGAGLTDLGHQQAGELAGKLGSHDISMLVTSHLLRTSQTAAPLAAELSLVPTVSPLVREVLAGDLEMASDQDSIISYLTTVAAWAEGDLSARIPGAESGHEVVDRFDAAVEQAENAVGDGLAVFVTHGAIMRVWAGVRGVNVPAGWAARKIVGNTGRIELTRERRGWVVDRWEARETAGGAGEDPAPGLSDPTAGPVAGRAAPGLGAAGGR